MAGVEDAWAALQAVGCTYQDDGMIVEVLDALRNRVTSQLLGSRAIFEAYLEVFGEHHPDDVYRS